MGRWLRWGVGLLALGALVAFGWRPLLQGLGAFLVVEDRLEPSAAIVVLNGHLPFRAMEAAELYRSGWAPQVALIRGHLWPEDRALEKLGIYRPQEWDWNREVLIRLGVPPSAIRFIDGRPRTTDEEVQVIARAFGDDEERPVIIVTSKYHTRRVRMLWNRLTGGRPRAIMRATRYDRFEPRSWWRDRRFALAVIREYLGLLHTWVGMPIGVTE